MARIQGHHISYEPEWVLDVTMQMHRCISRVQRTRATPQAYADLTNFNHAVAYEWNRMRQELDTGSDLRVVNPHPKPKKKKAAVVQLKNPATGRYTKINRATGEITGQKKSPGPYKGIPIARKRKIKRRMKERR